MPVFSVLRCHVAFAFKIRNHRALRCKQRCVASKANVAFAFKIRNHRALRCFLYLSVNESLVRHRNINSLCALIFQSSDNNYNNQYHIKRSPYYYQFILNEI